MKSFIITLTILGVTATAGVLIYLTHQKPLPASAPVVPSPSGQTAETMSPAKQPEKLETIPAKSDRPAPATVPPVVVNETNPADSASSIRKAVDALLSAKTGDQKHALFQQLAKSGRLDEAIAELKQRAADNPDDAALPTTIGEAQLNKLRAVSDAGGDMNDIGILAMQADQSLNAALKIDPSNWEAQFVKAAAMAHWPADATRDNDVVQRLSSLIDQQETMTPQPQFAQTYVVLGEQYLKIGKPDYALQTWQLGLTKFPGNPTLQQRINHPPGQ